MWWFFYVKKRYTVRISIISGLLINGDSTKMKRSCYIFLCGASFILLHVFSLYSTEYIYPITTTCNDTGQELILFMHQTAAQETRLWSLNIQTNSYEQLLSSQYNPIGVQLLPDNSGFSFLDNGLIKVKNFLKRSPKTIEIYEPIYNIGSIQWLDATSCFFHAKQGNRYGIFQVDLDGQLNNIIKSSSCDYLYPQKVGKDLFFIGRDLQGNHCVEKTTYPFIKKTIMSLNEAMDCAQENFEPVDNEVVRIMSFKKSTIVNLVMRNEYEGFLVEHLPIINTNPISISFKFYKLELGAEGVWNKKELFLFSLLSSLFFDKAIMLRDPMPALFPQVTSDSIYFISYHESTKSLSLYFYDIPSGSIKSCKNFSFLPVATNYLSNNKNAHSLMPIMTRQGLLSGYIWE